MKKKYLSIILAVVLVVSVMATAMVSVSARIDVNGRYVPTDPDSTYRYYFYMPKDWENNFTRSAIAGVFWYGGSDACSAIDDSNPEAPSWPGYIPQYEGTYNEGSVYYVDCPDDVPAIIWNNYVNGGTYENGIYQYSKEQFEAAKQTIDIIGLDDAETFSNLELYPDGLESFDNMIYVLDPSKVIKNELSGKEVYCGEWYYYYGDGKYGVQPTIEEAKAANAVMETVYQPPKAVTEPGTNPTEPNTNPTEPNTNPNETYTRPSDFQYPITDGKTINFDVWSANWGNIKNVYCHIYNYSCTDGKIYTAWQTKAELCTYNPSTGIATYDLQTGIDKGANGLETIDNSNKWVIMFSCNTQAETYSLIFNSDCFGDTIVADPNIKYEHPLDSEKTSIKIYYNKNTNLTSPKCITSSGKVQGETLADGITNETLLGDYLAIYAFDDRRVNKEIVSNIADELGIKASDALSYATYKISTEDYYYTSSEKINAINAVKKVIDEIENEVISEIIGDVDGDGKIGIDDATNIQKYMAEMLDFTDKQKELADVNKDRKVGVDDVTLIQKHMAGLDVIE